MTSRVLIFVNGLGLGNSTRCHAIVQQLVASGAQVGIVTSGNGLWYFKDYPELAEIFEIEALKYGNKDGRISIAGTIASVGGLAGVMRRNGARVEAILEKFRPDVAVTDSVYTFRPMKKAGIPLVALNNADVVYHSIKRFSDAPAEIKPQFYAVELMDYLFHRLAPDLVVSPALDLTIPALHGKVRRTGPIVRRECAPVSPTSESKKIVIMLSGSVFGSPVVLGPDPYPVHIDVVGRPEPEGYTARPDATYHGKVRNSLDIMREAGLCVINGGFSAVSEAFQMRKPMIVVPVPRHSEQWVNAKWIEKLGVGMMATEETFLEVMMTGLERVEEFNEAYAKLPVCANASEAAAQYILDAAGAKPS
jgi:UDP:flavonoid glycosyltransferase YjiC (YdhE family)